MAEAAARGEEGEEGEDELTRLVGRSPTYEHKPLSPEGAAHAAAFQPRPTDVFILTPPKTGTTWAQMLCHCLRTRGQPGDFEDIYQVAPWDQMAWYLGQDLASEQVAQPRLFKTHQRLSSINRGARYLCLVRGVEDVLRSWWNFLGPKDIPPLRKYSSASEFAFDEEFFARGMRFGASVWEYYREFFQALRSPSVLVLCYEDLVEDLAGHLPVIASFLGLPAGEFAEPAVVARIVEQCSRAGMASMASRFDESWAYKELQRVGRMQDPSTFAPTPRVNAERRPEEKEALSEAAQGLLRERWHEELGSRCGLADYAALRAAVGAELRERRRQLEHESR